MPTQTESSTHHQSRILVMDDEDHVRNILQKVLEKFGYQVDMTVDGEEAVTLYQTLLKDQIRPDLVVLDLTVPGGMGGKEAARLILEQDPEAKILISTGNPDDPQLIDHASCGIKEILAKPFRLDVLKERIADLLNQ